MCFISSFTKEATILSFLSPKAIRKNGDMRRIVGVSQADENIDETNENLLMVTSSNSSRRSRGESSSSTASSSRRGGHGRGLHSKATIRARTPSSDENKMKKKKDAVRNNQSRRNRPWTMCYRIRWRENQ